MAMRSKLFPLLVLVAALAGLVVSVGWAATRGGDDDWTMMRYGSAGMMGYAANGGDPVRNLAEARRQAQRFADRLDLRVAEVMRFTNHYYAELKEKNGRAATEVLVDSQTGGVYLEYGPAMMWNTRYGMMSDFRLRGSDGMMGGAMMSGGSGSGMMSGGSGEMMDDDSDGGMMSGGMMNGSGMMRGGSGGMMGDQTSTPGAATGDVSAKQAVAFASRWLARQGGDLTAGEAEAFPGYYTLHAFSDGRIVGMLSVNAATGAVWSHSWHGRFVSMLEA